MKIIDGIFRTINVEGEKYLAIRPDQAQLIEAIEMAADKGHSVNRVLLEGASLFTIFNIEKLTRDIDRRQKSGHIYVIAGLKTPKQIEEQKHNLSLRQAQAISAGNRKK